MHGVIPSIADWAATAGNFSTMARSRAVDAVIDTLACMVAGSDDSVTWAVRRAVVGNAHAHAQDAVRVVGGGRAAADRAALVNGTAAHALDFDDNFRPARSHASAVLVPALLAAAEWRGASGSDLVTAYIVGLEAQAVIGRGVNDAHYIAGWHPTGTIAAMGTAAGVARLIGLDAGGIADAMANAVSMAAGLKAQFGTAMKPVHAGLAARAAIDAARLAEAGIGGQHGILEQPGGFLALHGGPEAPGWDTVPEIGGTLAIETDGLLPKLYPCCGSTHFVLDALYGLKAEYGFAAADVAAVTTRVGVANFRNLPFAVPQDGMQARFSMPYCVALALLQDRLTLADFTAVAVQRPEVRRLLLMVSLTSHEAEADRRAAGTLPHAVEVLLHDGRRLWAERADVRGSIHAPFSEREKREKFVACVMAGGLTTAAAKLHYAALQDLAEVRSVDAALALLQASADSL